MIKILFFILFLSSYSFAKQPINSRCPIGDNTPGLVALWHMDIDENPITDSSGNGNTGSLKSANNPDFTTSSKFGGAYEFNGDDYILSSTVLDTTPGVGTVMFWYYPIGGASDHRVMLKFNIISPLNFLDIYWRSATNSLAARMYNAGSGNLTPTSDDCFPIRKWSHGALTWDGTKHYIYVNGVLEGSNTPGTFADGTDRDFVIGAYNHAGNTPTAYFLEGIIDDVVIYDRTLSAEEIKAEYYKKARYYN